MNSFTSTQWFDATPTWSVALDGLYTINKIVLTNRVNCCASRLRDIYVDVQLDGGVVETFGPLNPENVLGGGQLGVGPDELVIDLATPRVSDEVTVRRIPDPDNSGTGGLGDAYESNALSLAKVEVIGGALDTDGHADVIVLNDGEPNDVCIGASDGSFACLDLSADVLDSYSAALGLLNGDAVPDLVIANNNSPNRVCFGTGTGQFAGCSDVSSVDTFASRGVALGDLNGDGDLDAVFGNVNQPNRVCLGNGLGGFTNCANVSADANPTEIVTLGRVNGDAHLDAVFANFRTRNRVCFGDGLGGFSSCADVSSDSARTESVALGDLNGDTFLDAVFSNAPTDSEVCLGDGLGGFSCQLLDTRTGSNGVALGDVNGDGHLDAVFASWTQPSEVCIGSGTGSFTCEDMNSRLDRSTSVSLADMNGDGHLDAVITNWIAPNLLCLGDGTGAFNCRHLSQDVNNSRGAVLMPSPPAQGGATCFRLPDERGPLGDDPFTRWAPAAGGELDGMVGFRLIGDDGGMVFAAGDPVPGIDITIEQNPDGYIKAMVIVPSSDGRTTFMGVTQSGAIVTAKYNAPSESTTFAASADVVTAAEGPPGSLEILVTRDGVPVGEPTILMPGGAMSDADMITMLQVALNYHAKHGFLPRGTATSMVGYLERAKSPGPLPPDRWLYIVQNILRTLDSTKGDRHEPLPTYQMMVDDIQRIRDGS